MRASIHEFMILIINKVAAEDREALEVAVVEDDEQMLEVGVDKALVEVGDERMVAAVVVTEDLVVEVVVHSQMSQVVAAVEDQVVVEDGGGGDACWGFCPVFIINTSN
ncbi:hypothetical protein PIB30_118902 [Stylosanthes scabra]|uniref:Uncharacterized protein n=1 Tax=Stylosanthes scabra TaxID=79078 RepID=A0ABU6SP07_9FABA|nr:hypothetical protein [Stylosanthes scabra]